MKPTDYEIVVHGMEHEQQFQGCGVSGTGFHWRIDCGAPHLVPDLRTPSLSQRAGTVALFFGKNLLSQFGLGGQGDRLTVRTGEEITDTGRPTYHVEYKLSNRWYLVGEYDQFNEFNAGLKWRIYSK